MNVPRIVRTAQLRQQQAAALVTLLSDDEMPLSRYAADPRGVPIIGVGSGATWWTQPHSERAWRALHDPRMRVP